jgi:hypothetical protein
MGGGGAAPSTSTLTAPSDVPLALDASHTDGVDSFDTSVSCSTATSPGELKGTRARSPTLTTGGATRGMYGGVTGRVVGQ